MKPGSLMPHSQGLFNNPYLEPNQPNSPHIFKVHSNSVLPSTPRPPNNNNSNNNNNNNNDILLKKLLVVCKVRLRKII